MIGRLNGVLLSIENDTALIDVQGVGYEVVVPRRSLDKYAIGDSLTLHIHYTVTNEVPQLYGFESTTDRRVFRKLLGVSRFGPKSASALLSELSGREIALAIETQDTKALSSTPGIGKKVSESIVFALRDDVQKWGLSDAVSLGASDRRSTLPSTTRAQAILALRQLGFQIHEAERAVDSVEQDGLTVSTLTQRALMQLGTNL